jgi:hypothetical protein
MVPGAGLRRMKVLKKMEAGSQMIMTIVILLVPLVASPVVSGGFRNQTILKIPVVRTIILTVPLAV